MTFLFVCLFKLQEVGSLLLLGQKKEIFLLAGVTAVSDTFMRALPAELPNSIRT